MYLRPLTHTWCQLSERLQEELNEKKRTSKRLTKILGRFLQCMVGCTEDQMLTDCISPEGKVMRNQLEELIPFLQRVSVW